MDESFFDNSSLSNSYKKSKKRKKIIIALVLLLVLAGAGFVGQKFLVAQETVEKENVITPTPTDFIFPTETPTPIASPTATIKISPTKSSTPSKSISTTNKPSPTGLTTKTTDTDKSSLSIAVKNGSGQTGAASKMAAVLKEFGYKVASIGNADNFDYEGVTIEIKSEKSSFLTGLKKDLSADYTVSSATSGLSASSSADAVVIIGK